MGPCRVSSPISCSKQGQPRIQIRFLRALSTWVLKTCKDRRVHNPSGPLSQSLITLLVNLFFLVSRQILPSSNLSCRCGPQFVLSHLLFCLGRFGNNAKIRQAAVEDIKTGLLQRLRAGIRWDKVQQEHSGKQLGWKEREWTWGLGLTDKFCNLCVPETLGYTCTFDHIYRQRVWAQCLILGKEKKSGNFGFNWMCATASYIKNQRY